MFVIQYLVVAVVTCVLALLIGVWFDYSVGKSFGLALLALVVEQVMILGFVIFSALRRPADPQPKAATKAPDTITNQG